MIGVDRLSHAVPLLSVAGVVEALVGSVQDGVLRCASSIARTLSVPGVLARGGAARCSRGVVPVGQH
jgi:hypothetical protein